MSDTTTIDKRNEALVKARQAKAEAQALRNSQAVPAVAGTARPDMMPTTQEGARQAAEVQLQTQETAEAQEARAAATAAYNAVQEAADNRKQEQDRQRAELAADKAATKGDRLIEVVLERKYVPQNIADEDGIMVKQSGVMKSLNKGDTVKLPQAEALRAMQAGIAKPSDNAFDED